MMVKQKKSNVVGQTLPNFNFIGGTKNKISETVFLSCKMTNTANLEIAPHVGDTWTYGLADLAKFHHFAKQITQSYVPFWVSLIQNGTNA